jgi:hypothetical protein
MRSAISQVLFELFLVAAFAMVFVAGIAVGKAFAQDVTEDTKIWALKRAYAINNNSMVGPMIDLTGETPGAVAIKTEKITPAVVATAEPTAIPEIKPDVCQRHGMRRVSIHKGKSWRCVR